MDSNECVCRKCVNVAPACSQCLSLQCCVLQRVQELEATLYAILQQDPDNRLAESLSDRQRAELAESMEAVRRQILRQSRHADTLILQQRMELLQSAQQVSMCF